MEVTILQVQLTQKENAVRGYVEEELCIKIQSYAQQTRIALQQMFNQLPVQSKCFDTINQILQEINLTWTRSRLDGPGRRCTGQEQTTQVR